MKEKGFAPILILIGTVVVVSIVYGTYYLGAFKNNRPVTTPNIVQNTPYPTTAQNSISTPDEITNWKTYTNNYYRYSLKYPDKYRVRDIGDINYIGKTVFIEHANSQYPDAFTIYIDWDNGSNTIKQEFQKDFQIYLNDRVKGWCDATGVEGNIECDKILQQETFYTDSGFKGFIIYLNQLFISPDGTVKNRQTRGPLFVFDIYSLTDKTAKALIIEPSNGQQINSVETEDILQITKTLTFHTN